MNAVYSITIEFWDVLGAMAPYLLFGFLIAGLLSVLISAEAVERHLGGKGILSMLKATILGVPLPLCSCGVIPVAASLRRHGASRGATTAFLVSTPQTGVDSILVTYSLLGLVFAVFRPVAALISGILGGIAVRLAGAEEKAAGEAEQPVCEAECCVPDISHGRIYRAFKYGFMTLPQDIGRAMLVGLLIAGVISVAVPDDFFAEYIGTGMAGMIVMMLLGIPMYVCATASVPVAAALIAKGITPGAALVFLMTGPATNAAAITTIWRIMGRRSAMAYLAVVAITSLAAGIIMDYIFQSSGLSALPGQPWMMPALVKHVSGALLLAVLAAGIINRGRATPGRLEPAASDEGLILSVKGMTCSHCVESVRRAVAAQKGVEGVEVNLKSGMVKVTGRDIDRGAIERAIEELGYKACADECVGEIEK